MLVLTTSTLVTEDSEKAILVNAKELKQVIYIQYLITFPGSITKDGSTLDLVLALLDSGSGVNIIYPTFVEKLGFVVQTTNIGTQKIDGTIFETHGIIVTAFSVNDQTNKIRFFEKTFLVANVSPNIVFKMLFLTLNNADIDFLKTKL